MNNNRTKLIAHPCKL